MRRCCAALIVLQAAAYSGRTAPGRLAWVDRYLLLKEYVIFAEVAESTTRVFADIGIGDRATTTLELAAALQQDADAPLVVACEADATRCATARVDCAAAGVAVRQTDGSFALPLKWDEVCVGVRAMNVFRSGYTPLEAVRGMDALAAQLRPGAPLIEGSCSKNGDAGVAHVLRRTDGGVEREALIFAADVSRRKDFAPLALRAYLPRDLRRSFRAGSPVYEFTQRWTQAWKDVRRSEGDVFRAACEELRRRGDAVEWVDAGLMVWTPPGGVPLGEDL